MDAAVGLNSTSAAPDVGFVEGARAFAQAPLAQMVAVVVEHRDEIGGRGVRPRATIADVTVDDEDAAERLDTARADGAISTMA